MELKYKQKDIEELIDVFIKLDESEDKVLGIMENIDLLTKYPEEDLKVFVETLMLLEKTNTEVTKDNYYGVIGYILIRMNLLCS